jgi:hypothetical protein
MAGTSATGGLLTAAMSDVSVSNSGHYLSSPSFTVTFGAGSPLHKGSRVRVKQGFDCAGKIARYVGKSIHEADQVIIDFDHADGDDYSILAAAIEAFPYTRAELAHKEAKRLAKNHGLSKKARKAIAKTLVSSVWTAQP